MKINQIITLMLGSLMWFSACDSKDTAAPQAQVGLKFVTVKTAFPFNGRVATTNSLAFSSGTIVLSQVRFEGESASGFTEVKFEQEKDVTVDFATGATTPDISAAAFPPGTYRSVDVELELQDSGTKPAVVLNGTFTDGEGRQHPLRFEFNSAETFEVEKEGTIVFAEGQSAVAQVTFNPVAWFAGVSAEQLSAATKDAQGVIVISSTQNANIFDVVADGLDLATEIEIGK